MYWQLRPEQPFHISHLKTWQLAQNHQLNTPKKAHSAMSLFAVSVQKRGPTCKVWTAASWRETTDLHSGQREKVMKGVVKATDSNWHDKQVPSSLIIHMLALFWPITSLPKPGQISPQHLYKHSHTELAPYPRSIRHPNHNQHLMMFPQIKQADAKLIPSTATKYSESPSLIYSCPLCISLEER